MHYLDASLCVALLTSESGTERADAWRKKSSEEPLATSAWVHTEVSSALSMKVRAGSFSVEDRVAASVAWAEFRKGLHQLPITDDLLETAAIMMERYDLGLRAGDALHLAVAAAHGCTLATLDERMARAAPELGVPVAEV